MSNLQQVIGVEQWALSIWYKQGQHVIHEMHKLYICYFVLVFFSFQRTAAGANNRENWFSPTELNWSDLLQVQLGWLVPKYLPLEVHTAYRSIQFEEKRIQIPNDFIPVLNVLGALHVFPHQLHGDHPQRLHLPHPHPRRLEVSFWRKKFCRIFPGRFFSVEYLLAEYCIQNLCFHK